MNIYIAKSKDLDTVIFQSLSRLFTLFPGTLKFTFCPNDFLENNFFWGRDELHSVMLTYREEKGISRDDYLVFLTSRRDEDNWFSSCFHEWDRNIFVSTLEWTTDNFIDLERKEYPIAYQIVENIFQHLTADSYEKYESMAHFETIGCINDMCLEKRHILFKLRTADICFECGEHAKRLLNDDIFSQIIEILENIRFQFLHNKRAFEIFQKSILASKLKALEDLILFLSDNLGNNERAIQNWIDEDDGLHRRRRAMIFGLDFVDIKREGEIHMRKRFDILAEQNTNSHVILELKSPSAKIFNVENNPNANGGQQTTYSLSTDLARAIPQILAYKNWYDNMSDEQVEAMGIGTKKNISECIIVIGQRQENAVWKINFQNLKQNMSIKILTYDDLIDKMKNTIANLEIILR